MHLSNIRNQHRTFFWDEGKVRPYVFMCGSNCRKRNVEIQPWTALVG